MTSNARRLDLTEDDYHADALPEWAGTVPSLSNSIAKVLLDKSPAHAYARHPRLGGQRKESALFDAGKLAHKLLLGEGPKIHVIDAMTKGTKTKAAKLVDDYRSDEAQQQRDEARKAGKIPTLAGPYESALKAADIVRGKLAKLGITLDGESEVMVTWQERQHDPVRCRGMLDHVIIRDGRAMIWDLKTTKDASPRACSNSIVRYGYDTQRAAYTRALSALYPGLRAADIGFGFIFAETEPPYAVTCGRLDEILRERGEERWIQAVDLWADCLRFNQWPEYATSVVEFAAPHWIGGDIEIGFEEE